MTIYRGRTYLDKHRFLPRSISSPPASSLGIVVCIPCHNEPHLLRTLASIEATDSPPCGVEVLIVLNASTVHPKNIHHSNLDTLEKFQVWRQISPKKYAYHLIYTPDLPPKHAGVGLARKIGMDEAVDRFEQKGSPQGIIVGLDADTLVAPTYLQEIWKFFASNPSVEAVSIDFEHPLHGDEFPQKVYQGILRYEVFLRYYLEGLRFAGHPHAYHTIGSSMAVRSSAYQKEGGMNRRKAGEDFYFLQKFIQNSTLQELHSTCVYPSPRPSDKVPFGTGKAINEWLQQDSAQYLTYNWRSFLDLKELVDQVPHLYHNQTHSFSEKVRPFLEQENLSEALNTIRTHVSSPQAFIKRFFKWFDALKALKFIHYSRDEVHPEQELLDAVKGLAKHAFPGNPTLPDYQEALQYLRTRQRSG